MAGASSQPAIFDRDGRKLTTLMMGDMYIRDMRTTKGHVAACTACAWHVHDRTTVAAHPHARPVTTHPHAHPHPELQPDPPPAPAPHQVTTAGEDGTVRLWDVEVAVERGDDATSLNVNGGQKQVAVLKDRRGIKTGCTAVAWQPDGQVRVRVNPNPNPNPYPNPNPSPK